MRHFNYLTDKERKNIFLVEPKIFERDTDKEMMAYALGAMLYMPATREKIAEDIISQKHKGLMSMAICLEDAIGDREVMQAEQLLIAHLQRLYEALQNEEIQYEMLPFIFIRVRKPEQMARIAALAGQMISLLTGFIFPKFSYDNGRCYFETLKEINQSFGTKLYGMPILESRDIIYWETRQETLGKINEILGEYHDLVLNVRIGATDFSGLFGIRRGCDQTIYDIQVIRDCMTDIINNFCRVERQYVVSGPVWEYFTSNDRVLKPQLRRTPFKQQYGENGLTIRSKLLDECLDGLIYEVLLDRANGLIGKTIIHPSHIIPVQSLYVVNHEEYEDACSILENINGEKGVIKSLYSNKMNEIKPHTNWAKRIMMRSKLYGVFNHGQEFIRLL